MKKKGYLWVTLGFFILSIAGHWIFALFAYADEQKDLGLPVKAGSSGNLTKNT